MGIRNTLGKNKVYITLSHAYYRLLTRISPTLNTKVRFKKLYGRKLDLDNPRLYCEKMQWLKLNAYNKSPFIKRLCSRSQSLDYVRAAGCGKFVLEPIGIWNSVDEIDWDALPDKFVIKSTLGCGGHVFCLDKSAFDREAAKRTLLDTADMRHYLDYAELQYKPDGAVPQQFIAERLLEGGHGLLPDDFKVHCFNGEPTHLMYCFDRGLDGKGKAQFVIAALPEWREEPELLKKKCDVFPERPVFLDEMLACARTLSKPFPYVRVDFLVERTTPYFCEMTFTPAGGMGLLYSDEAEERLGRELDLSKFDAEAFRKLT